MEIGGWTDAQLRHLVALVRQGRNPVARVYESIGSDFFLALAPGWLNLGLWEGQGSEAEAATACRRLVEAVAAPLPRAGVVVDVGNGLATQDPVIAQALRPRTLVTVNITEWQLMAGRDRLCEANALPVVADATRLPIADASADGIISVEAAFHFSSRRAFFDECHRVLRPGGVLSFSDISTARWPHDPVEAVAGVAMMRVFGLRRAAVMHVTEIAAAARAAGLRDVEVLTCGERVIGPAIRVAHARLDGPLDVGPGQRLAARVLLWQAELLWRHRLIEYVLVRAVRP